jgi:hypothetical protein
VTSVVENENVYVEERQQMQSKDLLAKPAITKTPFKYKVNGISPTGDTLYISSFSRVEKSCMRKLLRPNLCPERPMLKRM